MEVPPSTPAPSLVGRLIKLQLKSFWFFLTHPVLTLLLVSLLAFSSFSFFAHFNPAIADRFTNAAAYFGAATLASEASDVVRRQKKKLSTVEADNRKLKSRIAKSNIAFLETAGTASSKEAKLKRSKLTITRQRAALIDATYSLRKASSSLYRSADHVKKLESSIKAQNTRINKFRERGKQLEAGTKKRFTKVALLDSGGEIIGWIPILGDAASIGFAAGGIYEMCQMFKEIELATRELGVPYMVYTDTFCEKPAEKTAELVAEKSDQLKGSLVGMTMVLKENISSIPMPDTKAIQDALNSSYTYMRDLL